MNLSKRIALSSTIILIFFFATIVVFLWTNDIRRQTIDELQATIRTQYLVSEVSDELAQFNKRLQVLEAFAGARGESGLEDSERDNLWTGISAIDESLAIVQETATGDISRQLNGTRSAAGIVSEWKDLINWTIENNQRVQVETLTDFTSEFEDTDRQLRADSLLLRTRAQSLNDELGEVESVINHMTLAVFAASALISLLLTFNLIRFTTRSLKALREGTRQWSDGQLQHRVKVTGKDDLSQLARAFNGMANNLEVALREANEERLRANKANKAKSGFLANMSHELRTPMNAIIGYSEMLIEEIEDEGSLDLDDAQEDLHKILSAGKHLLGLINEILDLSKIEAGKMGVFYEDTDVVSLIEEVCSTVKPLVDNFDNTLDLQLDIADRNMETDVTKFRQILMNLLSNAAKFTKRGRITVSAERVAGSNGSELIRVSVRDTGIGMTPEQMAKVFEEFTQADDSTTREFGGTGLGLSICRSFAKLMKGNIEVESQVGVGTTFTFEVPTAQPKETEKESRRTDALAEEHIEVSGLATILIIDDDTDSLDLSSRILTKRGYSVLKAETGKDGIALAQQKKPDLIVLDVIMPGMDGWQVLEELKGDEATHDIPIIMQSMLSERELGLARGADDYLIKPIDKLKLTGAIRQLLPGVDTHKGLLIVEQGTTVFELIAEHAREEDWELKATDDPEQAEQWLAEREFGVVLIGRHEQTDRMAKLMDALSGRPRAETPPILLLSSVDPSENDPEQLLSFLSTMQPRSGKAPAS